VGRAIILKRERKLQPLVVPHHRCREGGGKKRGIRFRRGGKKKWEGTACDDRKNERANPRKKKCAVSFTQKKKSDGRRMLSCTGVFHAGRGKGGERGVWGPGVGRKIEEKEKSARQHRRLLFGVVTTMAKKEGEKATPSQFSEEKREKRACVPSPRPLRLDHSTDEEKKKTVGRVSVEKGKRGKGRKKNFPETKCGPARRLTMKEGENSLDALAGGGKRNCEQKIRD